MARLELSSTAEITADDLEPTAVIDTDARPATPAPPIIPAGYVQCDECDAIVRKPSLAQHQQTLCLANTSHCVLSRDHDDLCGLRHSVGISAGDSGGGGEDGELESVDDLTRFDVITHIDQSPGAHVLYLMDLIDTQSRAIAALQQSLAEERSHRLSMETQLKEVILKLAETVDRANVVQFHNNHQYNNHSTPVVSRTSSGRLIERRTLGSAMRASRSPVRAPEPPPVEPLPVSNTGWKPKRTAITDADGSEDSDRAKQLHVTLNKLTPTNYDKLSERILTILQSVTDFTVLSKFTSQIFEKSLLDIFYGWMFADLCKLIVEQLPPVDSANPKTTSFKYCLLNLCQIEFERGANIHKATDTQTVSGSSIGSDTQTDGGSCTGSGGSNGVDKARQIASIRFIGELFLRSIIGIRIMLPCLNQLKAEILSSHSEAAVEGLCQLLMTIGPKLDTLIAERDTIHLFYADISAMINTHPSVTNRSKFLWLDVVELRGSQWQKRKNLKEDRASSVKLEQRDVGNDEDDGYGDEDDRQSLRVSFSDHRPSHSHSHSHHQHHHHHSNPAPKVVRIDTDLMIEQSVSDRQVQSFGMAASVKKWEPKKKVTIK